MAMIATPPSVDPLSLRRFGDIVTNALKAFREDTSYAADIVTEAQKQAARRRASRAAN